MVQAGGRKAGGARGAHRIARTIAHAAEVARIHIAPQAGACGPERLAAAALEAGPCESQAAYAELGALALEHHDDRDAAHDLLRALRADLAAHILLDEACDAAAHLHLELAWILDGGPEPDDDLGTLWPEE